MAASNVDVKALKQAKFVIDSLNKWRGGNQHSLSDLQAALGSAIQLSLLEEVAILDTDTCSVATIAPWLVQMVNLDSQQELSNALPRIKTWGELRSFLETGAKKGIGEFIATTKRCFDPTSDPLLKDASIPGVIQELVKTLKKSGIPEGKISRLTKEGALEEYIHGGKAVDSMNQTEARAKL